MDKVEILVIVVIGIVIGAIIGDLLQTVFFPQFFTDLLRQIAATAPNGTSVTNTETTVSNQARIAIDLLFGGGGGLAVLAFISISEGGDD